MLGKLYVSPTSTPEKLHATHELLTEAIEGRTAPSRNALNKLLTALTKAIGAGGAATTTTTTTATATVTATKHEADEGHGYLTVCEDGVTGTNAEEHEEVMEMGMDMESVEGAKEVDGGASEGMESILDEAEAEEEL